MCIEYSHEIFGIGSKRADSVRCMVVKYFVKCESVKDAIIYFRDMKYNNRKERDYAFHILGRMIELNEMQLYINKQAN